MRIRKVTGLTTNEIMILVALLGILVAVIGGHYADKNAELAAAQKANQSWQKKDCNYFGKRAVEEANGKDYEKVVLYLKLHGACLDLYGIQPKTPE